MMKGRGDRFIKKHFGRLPYTFCWFLAFLMALATPFSTHPPPSIDWDGEVGVSSLRLTSPSHKSYSSPSSSSSLLLFCWGGTPPKVELLDTPISAKEFFMTGGSAGVITPSFTFGRFFAGVKIIVLILRVVI